MKKKISTSSIVFVALFIALTFIGTTIKIPVFGAFIHFGNAILLLAVLLLGYFKGALAGGIGFALFDTFNGYITEAPYFILESFIVGGAATLVVISFKHKIDSVQKVAVVALTAGIVKIIMTQLKNTLASILLGTSFIPAFTGALSKLPATLINVTTTIIIVSLIYLPLKKALDRLTVNRLY